MPFPKRAPAKQPEIYRVSTRAKMSPAQAAKQPMEPETPTGAVFNSEKDALNWIRRQAEGDPPRVFVVRDRKGVMTASYSYRKGDWRRINQGGYFGGYKIGEPLCSGLGASEDDHPVCFAV